MTQATPPDELDEDDALAAEVALRLLSGPEAKRAERRMRDDPDFAGRVAAWEHRLADMAEAEITPVTPPRRTARALNRRLFPRPARSRHVWGWVGGAVTAAMLVLGVLAIQGWLLAPTAAPFAARLASQDGQLVLEARGPNARGLFEIRVRQGRADAGRSLQLWLIPEGGAPVSLGLLGQAGASGFGVPAALRGALDGAALAVSDEPAGGSRTGRPTGPVLAVAPLMPL